MILGRIVLIAISSAAILDSPQAVGGATTTTVTVRLKADTTYN